MIPEIEYFNFYGVSYTGNQFRDIKEVFKNRKYFSYLISQNELKIKLNEYNTKRTISDEELTLKINHLRKSIVANVIGVIDLLYHKYKLKLGGEGIIVKEGFDTAKVEDDLKKFQGNIYRMLEWALYKKFQNYGLVPPIKNLLSLRGSGIDDKKENEIMILGNIGFVSKSGTSQKCPICGEKNKREKDEQKKLKDAKKFLCDHQECSFDSINIFHSNDGVAGFNIAKRGFENL